ncbi:CPBP family glutamic-type intramembrane protease [Klugiella xanthotipulae]|uniref:CAAX prenyl protease 2/Lysostaphin resistance protein A-like domain-containing protein n=1 Tax=Klugiella xanthotipulae TaxID=244735 RepID=A0A543I3V7_9MICO|nr:CPBP family glutamic-type intramembrane protease [Klugiella xanthotipulae]TQM65231.1 hypothetical protein FB466_0021 [Klugiella xanthotipulae]
MREDLDALTLKKLRKSFTNPEWLVGDNLKDKKNWLLGSLILLLGLYLLNWGLSIERAFRCLADGTPPQGRWVDDLATSAYVPVVVAILSLAVLKYASGRFTASFPRKRYQWSELTYVGFAWALPIFFTRLIATWVPETPCVTSSERIPLFSLYQLGGPIEEVWFAAVISIWMLLMTEHPRAKFIGVILGGGVLRGIFHVFQGWESIGLFVWGACAALLVAMTGRWLLLFFLHLLNNALVYSFGSSALEAATCALFVCVVIWGVSESKNKKVPLHSKLPKGAAGGDDCS